MVEEKNGGFCEKGIGHKGTKTRICQQQAGMHKGKITLRVSLCLRVLVA